MRVCQVREITVDLNFYLLTAMKNNLLKKQQEEEQQKSK